MMNKTSDFTYLEEFLPFWDQLTEEEKILLQDNVKEVSFDKNTNLYNGESNCLGVIFVKTGCIRVSLMSPEGREITLYRLTKHDFCIFSASCILSMITFDVNVTAETDCTMLLISPRIYEILQKKNVYVENFTYKTAMQRFSDVMWTMQQILFSSFDKRLANFLLAESYRTKNTTIEMTHEQIAINLGSAREVVSRMLKYFEKEKIVTLSRGKVTILDTDKLKEL